MIPNMSATYEQFANVHKANMEAFKTMTQATLASTERLTGLNLEAARGLLEAGVSNTSVLLGTQVPQDSGALANHLFRASHDNIGALYSRGLYEIAADMQKAISTVMAERLVGAGASAAEQVASDARPRRAA